VLIFGPTGTAVSPSHTRKEDRLYHYCFRQDVLKRGPDRAGGRDRGDRHRPAARNIPSAGDHRRRAARAEQEDITEEEARAALAELDPLWDGQFPAEQARMEGPLVERVGVRMCGVEVRLRPNELAGLMREMADSRMAAARPG